MNVEEILARAAAKTKGKVTDVEEVRAERQATNIVRRHRELQDARADLPGYTPSLATPIAPVRPSYGLPEASPGVADLPPSPSRTEQDSLAALMKADFKVFLTVFLRHLGAIGPQDNPAPVLLSIADFLQYGPRSAVIMAFRGVGKSWITAAFAIWTLYCNPQKKIMVVSGSMKRAVAFTTFCLAVIRNWDVVIHLAPHQDQRQSATLFDVGPALPDQSASLSAFGITGQIVGQRADLIIADDVETNVNSMTIMMREKLADAIREFDAILKPGGQVRFLGTPQTNDSIYNKLPARGYTVRIWPIVYPNAKQIARYGDKLSPFILNRSAGHEGQPTNPERFGMNEIDRQRLSWGASGFDLQFMLDTTLSDASRYPLKVSNLICMALEPSQGPEDVVWGKDEGLALPIGVIGGFPGDRLYKPQAVGTHFRKWNSVKATIDTSDTGDDETALTIGAELNGRLFILWCQGWIDGSSPSTMLAIAKCLVRFSVNEVTIETNFGGTMFGQLLKPVLQQQWAIENALRAAANRTNKPADHREPGGTIIIDERAQRVQKELRIIADVEPATQAHRIVVSTEVFEFDYTDVMQRENGDMKDRYSLAYQFTNLTRDRNSLAHDDKLDSLASLVGIYRDILGVNPNAMAHMHREEEVEEAWERELQDAIEVGAAYAAPKTPWSRHKDPRERRGA